MADNFNILDRPVRNFLHVQDIKAGNTPGGTNTIAAWTERTLNTVLTNEINGASLASDRITLPAGDYYLQARSPYNLISRVQTRIYNVTDAASILQSTGMYTSVSVCSVISNISGKFTLATESDISLEYYTQVVRTNTGLGSETFTQTGADNVYSDVSIWQL